MLLKHAVGEVPIKHVLSFKGPLKHDFNIKLKAPDPAWYIIGASVFLAGSGVFMWGAAHLAESGALRWWRELIYYSIFSKKAPKPKRPKTGSGASTQEKPRQDGQVAEVNVVAAALGMAGDEATR